MKRKTQRLTLTFLSVSLLIIGFAGFGASASGGQWVAVQTLSASVLPKGFTTAHGSVWIGADLQAAGSGYLLSYVQSGGTWVRSTTIAIQNTAATGVSFGLTAGNDGSLWMTPTYDEVQQATESSGSWSLQPPITVGTGGHALTTGLDGSIWVANEGDNTVQQIAQVNGVWTALSPISVGSEPDAMATGSDGSIWVANSSSLSNSVQQISDINGDWTAGAPITVGNDPANLTTGLDGSIWVANEGDNTVQQIAQVNGAWTAQSPISVSPGPQAITTGSDGSIWVGESSNRVQEITNSGGTWTAQSPINGGGDPSTMGATSDGSIWALNANASNVTRYSNTLTTTTTSSQSPPPTVPGPPRSVKVKVENAAIVVSWSIPKSDGQLPITGFTVVANPGSKRCRTRGSLSCTLKGLKDRERYSLSVSAANRLGSGPRSKIVQVVLSKK
jgi:virginiamycin B lyase